MAIQLHCVSILRVVEGGRHPGPAIQVLPASTRDHHPLAEERALGAYELVDEVQSLVPPLIPWG